MARCKAVAHPAGGADANPLVDRDPALVEPSGGGEDQDALQALLDGLDDPTGYEVCVFEVNTDGTRHMLARQGVSEFDPWAFGEQWGGGTYEMRLRDTSTKRWGRQRRFTVSPRVARRHVTTPTSAGTPPPTAAAADPSRDMLALMMGLVQNQAQQQTAILTALIGRPQSATPLGELVQAAQLLTGRGHSSPIGELLEGVERIQKLTAANGASASDEVELARTLAPVIGELLKQQPAARAAAPASAGGAGAVALPPASPASTHAAAPSPRPAAPRTPREHAQAATASAAIDTLSAIIVRVGLDAGGSIDEGAIERITTQALDGIDPDALVDMLDLVPAGHLPDYVLAATPAMVREQVAQHRDALRRIEAALREEFDDADGEASTPAQQEEHRVTTS